MSQHRSRIVGLLALLAALVLAPTALAAAPTQSQAGAGKAKERAYGKHCGAARKASVRSGERAKCVDALDKLATGRSSSPRKACRALSRKRGKGLRTSAYARCVKAGTKLMKSKRRGSGGGAEGADGTGDVDLDPDVDGSDDVDGDTGPGGGADGAAMGEPEDDWDPASEPADDNDPDPALDTRPA
ncbi:MAG TPA: hypothetical protein VNA28_08460 [Solirubrobacteraceae bacterium]|nr:hypothetical protein [Solirubrobacteraceae bacterium]